MNTFAVRSIRAIMCSAIAVGLIGPCVGHDDVKETVITSDAQSGPTSKPKAKSAKAFEKVSPYSEQSREPIPLAVLAA